MIDKKRATKVSKMASVPLVNPNAAGIDVGDTLLTVAVPEGRDTVSLRMFGAFTGDLRAISEWLKRCGIETVAMESTGIYWKSLFKVLVHDGFEVYLVNAQQTKHVAGRKTDENDAQWIQRLHSYGFLTSSVLPDDQTESLRSLVRFRRTLIQDRSRYVLRMQKSLEAMNIKLHTVIRDITGKTGLAIVGAILAGEREPEHFMPFVDGHIKADEDTLKKSLEGIWRPEHLATLKISYEMYTAVTGQMQECDRYIERLLCEWTPASQAEHTERDDRSEQTPDDMPEAMEKETRKRKHKNRPSFDLRPYLKKIHGVDVLEIYGINEIGALEIFAETGSDLSKWPTENHFVSWLNFCPNIEITGGKVVSTARLKKKPNLAALSFQHAAVGVQASDNWLGDYFRRKRAKGGQKYAMIATARKISTIYYKVVRYKIPFKPIEMTEYKEQYRQTKIAYFERKLAKLRAAA